MRKKEKIELVCKACGHKFLVLPCMTNRKYCSAICAHSLGNKGENWRGGTLKGKGSRGKYSESSVKARSEAKIKKHLKELDRWVDADKLNEIVNLNYCDSLELIFRYAGKKDLGRGNILKRYLDYKGLLERFLNTPHYYEAIRTSNPKDFLVLISLLKSCSDWIDFQSEFKLRKLNISNGILNPKYLYSLVQNQNIETSVFDKLGNKRYASSGTSIEKIIRNILIEMKLPFQEQFKIKNYKADFFVKNCLIIEVNGDYWHGWNNGNYSQKWKDYCKERDELKYSFYECEQIPYIIIWEHEILNSSKEELKNKILLGVVNARN